MPGTETRRSWAARHRPQEAADPSAKRRPSGDGRGAGLPRTASPRSVSMPAQLLLQPGEMRVHAPGEARVLELAPALALAADHLDQLPAAGDQLAEVPRGPVRQRPGLRPHGLSPPVGPKGRRRTGSACDGLCVQPVGLGQPPCSPCDITDLALRRLLAPAISWTDRCASCARWIDDHERQASGAQRGGYGRLEATSGLEHDQPRGEPGQPVGQRREAGGIPTNGKGLTSRAAHAHRAGSWRHRCRRTPFLPRIAP